MANFLARYKNQLELDPQELREIWRHYDVDNSGFIERGELAGLARDMLEVGVKGEVTELMVQDLVTGILDFVDENADGKLGRVELEVLLAEM